MTGISGESQGGLELSKYNNQKTLVDGIMFDSKKEAKRYGELNLLFKKGKITYLETQPKYEIIIKGKKICSYIADFRYIIGGKEIIVEDVKGFKTSTYRLKKKLMKAIYGIDIYET